MAKIKKSTVGNKTAAKSKTKNKINSSNFLDQIFSLEEDVLTQPSFGQEKQLRCYNISKGTSFDLEGPVSDFVSEIVQNSRKSARSILKKVYPEFETNLQLEKQTVEMVKELVEHQIITAK